MKYKCLNEKCKLCGREFEFISVTYKVVGDKLVSNESSCPECGKNRVEINENENIPISEKNIGINEFSSMSKEQRVAALKKRSHDHFEKNIKQSKNDKINTAVKNFKNA